MHYRVAHPDHRNMADKMIKKKKCEDNYDGIKFINELKIGKKLYMTK